MIATAHTYTSPAWSSLALRYRDEVRQFLDASILALRRGKEDLARVLRVRAMTNWRILLQEAL